MIDRDIWSFLLYWVFFSWKRRSNATFHSMSELCRVYEFGLLPFNLHWLG